MKNWKQVTCCPHCGGKLLVSIHLGLTHDYTITKAGVLSRRYTVSPPGELGCTTAFCVDCKRAWDGDQVFVEQDDTVWVRE